MTPQLVMLDDRLVAIASPIASMQGLALGLVRSMDAMRRARDAAKSAAPDTSHTACNRLE